MEFPVGSDEGSSPRPESRDAVPQGRGSSGREGSGGSAAPGRSAGKAGMRGRNAGCGRGCQGNHSFSISCLPPLRSRAGDARAGCGLRDSGFGMRDEGLGFGGIGLRIPASAAPGRSRWSGNAPAGSRRTAQPGGRRAEGTALFCGGNPGAESCAAFIFSWKADACGVGMRERGKIPSAHPCSVFRFKRSGSSRSSDPGQAGLSAGDGSQPSIFPARLLPPGRRA